MSRGRGGRGGGRFRFGGSRDSTLADMLDETREDLGLSHSQMELLHAERGSALYPPLQLPQPEPLSDRDAFLVQRQRLLAHKLEGLYQPWGQDAAASGGGGSDATNPAAFVHLTTPAVLKDGEVFVPAELRANSLSGGARSGQHGAAPHARGIMQPRAFESVFKSLEAQEQKQSDKSRAGAADDDADDMDEPDEDLGDDMNDYTFDYYDSDAASDDGGDEEVFF